MLSRNDMLRIPPEHLITSWLLQDPKKGSEDLLSLSGMKGIMQALISGARGMLGTGDSPGAGAGPGGQADGSDLDLDPSARELLKELTKAAEPMAFHMAEMGLAVQQGIRAALDEPPSSLSSSAAASAAAGLGSKPPITIAFAAGPAGSPPAKATASASATDQANGLVSALSRPCVSPALAQIMLGCPWWYRGLLALCAWWLHDS